MNVLARYDNLDVHEIAKLIKFINFAIEVDRQLISDTILVIFLETCTVQNLQNGNTLLKRILIESDALNAYLVDEIGQLQKQIASGEMQSNYQKNTAAKYVQIYEKVSVLEMLDFKQFE